MNNHLPSSLSRLLAQILSALLHPVLIPLFGTLLLIGASSRLGQPLGTIELYFVLGFTIFCTFIPIIAVITSRKKGKLEDLYQSRSVRIRTYWASICMILLWLSQMFDNTSVFIEIYPIPLAIILIIFIVLLITFFWRISMHMAAWGGLVGGVYAYAWHYCLCPYALFALLFVLSLLVAWARLRLNAHTPAQVVAGYLLGLSVMFATIQYL